MQLRALKFSSWIPLTILLLITACVPQDQTVDESLWTRTPTPAPTATMTVQWFPATDTPLPVYTPTFAPTPNLRPGIGNVLLEDNFEGGKHWLLGRSPAGSMAFGNNDLTLAVSQARGSLFSLRDGPVLDNFDLRVTTEVSLCKDNDYYGLLVRAISPQDFYRYSVACNGSVRLDRVKNSSTVTLYAWSPSGQVPPGSPVVLTLGVWAQGKELRFFINDVFQFAVTDGVFPRGRVGVFARSMGTTALTVSFSNLSVHDLAGDSARVIEASATPTPKK